MVNTVAIMAEFEKQASCHPTVVPFAGHMERLYEECLIRPGTFIELGVFNVGPVSTTAFLRAAVATDSALYSCDMEPCEHTRQFVRKQFDIDDTSELWSFYQEDSVAFGRRWAEMWPIPQPINVLLIDTSHKARQTRKELEIWLPQLHEEGVALCHDTVSHPEGVLIPIEEYVEAHPEFGFENIEESHGLGVIWRQTDVE